MNSAHIQRWNDMEYHYDVEMISTRVTAIWCWFDDSTSLIYDLRFKDKSAWKIWKCMKNDWMISESSDRSVIETEWWKKISFGNIFIYNLNLIEFFVDSLHSNDGYFPSLEKYCNFHFSQLVCINWRNC